MISTRHPASARAHFLQAHRQRIRLLAGRAGGAPDPDALAGRARLQHLGHDRIAEVIERHLVAKEEGLVGGHGFDHLGDKGCRPALHLLHEFADAGEAAFARQRKQAAFDQILLVCGQVETGMILQELTQILIVWRGHEGLSRASGKGLDRCLFRELDQADFLELRGDDVLVERLHDVFVGAGMQRARDMATSFSVVQNTTLGASPPGMRRRLPRNS